MVARQAFYLQATAVCKTPFVLLMHLRNSILKVVTYFDLFKYPVSPEEIRFFLDQDAEAGTIQTTLNELCQEGCLFGIGDFYSLRNDPLLVTRRLKGNQHAEELLRIAARISRRLFQFPYVRGIGISGSLSKHYAEEDADIDYFIITRRNRLWIARTLMHLFKKLSFLTGRQHWYCMNYYIDEEALEIEEKNIFTATELITLLPACGNGELSKFFEANNWVCDFFPHYIHRSHMAQSPSASSRIKQGLEKIFDNPIGDRLDDFLRRLTTRRWQHKEERGALNQKGGRLSLKTSKHFSRPNPAMFQKKILSSYLHNLNEFSEKWSLTPSSANG